MRKEQDDPRDPRLDRTDAAEIEPRDRTAEEPPAQDETPAQGASATRDTEPAQPATPSDESAPETATRPAPGIRHMPEPDAENIIPVKDEPGTL
jgi:hypothetical protein